MNELITVIVPIYNRFDLANRCLYSVLNQSYKNWQLIIIDDCSLLNFKLNNEFLNIEQEIILLRNQDNLGPGLSRQRGLDIANGDFISFLDSDDYWHSDFLKESLNVHLKNLNICATYCQSKLTNGELRRRNDINDSVDNIFLGVVSGARPWATCSVLWRRKYLSVWSKLRTNQDALFELQTALNNPKIKFIPKILCVVDKDTGENAKDLVNINVGNRNRTIVLLKSISFMSSYRFESKVKIKYYIWISLYSQSKKMIKQRNYYYFLVIFFNLIYKISWFLRYKYKIYCFYIKT
jgi:glycosyltransferase involved in cell wall biosynthesis